MYLACKNVSYKKIWHIKGVCKWYFWLYMNDVCMCSDAQPKADVNTVYKSLKFFTLQSISGPNSTHRYRLQQLLLKHSSGFVRKRLPHQSIASINQSNMFYRGRQLMNVPLGWWSFGKISKTFSFIKKNYSLLSAVLFIKLYPQDATEHNACLIKVTLQESVSTFGWSELRSYSGD